MTLAAALRDRGITLNLPPGATPRIVADPVRLRQILTNLVGNAIKFTEPGGAVTVEVGQTRSATRISVRDTGIGIRAEDLERAFLPFEQVSRTSTAGAGLGLAISRSLAELHGGTLEATSELGAGSAFTLTLPRRPRPSAQGPAPAPEVPMPGRPDGSGRAILVVEDDPTTLAQAAEVLQMVGYEVRQAAGLKEAQRSLARAVPDLMVVDLRLGDGSGLDLIAEARSRPSTATMPILVLSADTMPDDVRRAREAGCDDFLPKPIRPRILLDRIRQLTDGRPEAGTARR
jgi:CheY-like chemotaxis protein/anti-sigma regulatory factor (Ser/Thr protein kinase)